MQKAEEKLCFVGDLLQERGSCQGDSGGPLMKRVYELQTKFFQYGIVHGGVGECGNNKYPNIFARVEDPEINGFIREEMGREKKNKTNMLV